MAQLKQQPKTTIAVLSGDIVRSTSLSHQEYEDLLYTLYNQLAFVCSLHPKNQHEMTRGDSFQLIVHDPQNAALYALLIRTSLKSRNITFDCRISIGIGSDDVIRHNVGSSTGQAFTLSGRALDDMSNDTLIISTPKLKFNQQFQLLTKYLDHQILDMTARQCAITYLKLKTKDTLTQHKIAEALGAKRTSISRSMKTARIDLIEDYIILFNHRVQELLL